MWRLLIYWLVEQQIGYLKTEELMVNISSELINSAPREVIRRNSAAKNDLFLLILVTTLKKAFFFFLRIGGIWVYSWCQVNFSVLSKLSTSFTFKILVFGLFKMSTGTLWHFSQLSASKWAFLISMISDYLKAITFLSHKLIPLYTAGSWCFT